MPLPVLPPLDINTFMALASSAANVLIGEKATFSNEALGWLPHTENFAVAAFTREAQETLANLYNLEEFSAQQLADIASLSEQIIGAIGGGGGVDLSTVESYLAANNQWLSSIYSAVRGGSGADTTSLLSAIVSELDAVAVQIELAPQVSNFATLTAADRVTAALRENGGASVGDELAGLNKAAALIIQLLAQSLAGAGAGAGAGPDATRQSSALSAAIGAIAQMGQNPSATDYTDFLRHSSPDDLGTGLARVGNSLLQVLQGNFFSTKESEALNAIVKDGDFSKARVQLTDYGHWLAAQPAEVLTDIIGKLFSAIGTITERLEPALDGLFRPIFDQMVNSIHDTIGGFKEVSPASGFSVAKEMLIKAAGLGLHAHHLAELFEMIPWSKHFGIHTTTAFLADMAAFAPMSQETWGRAIGEGVGRPATYEINAAMRSKIPDAGALLDGMTRRKITPENVSALLAYHGYNDSFIDFLIRSSWRQPRLREIIMLASDAGVDDAQIAEWLGKAGYEDVDIQAMTPILAQQAARAQRQSLMTEVLTNLGGGYLSENEAAQYWDFLNLPDQARQYLNMTARLKFRRDIITDAESNITKQHTDGLMSEAEMRAALSALGIRSEKVNSIASKAAAARTGAVFKKETAANETAMRHQQTLTIARLKEQYQLGQIDAAGFTTGLTSIGVEANAAAEIVYLEELKLFGKQTEARTTETQRQLTQLRNTRTQAFVEMFRKGQINRSQLSVLLQQIGDTVDQANAIADREQASAQPTTSQLQKIPGAVKAKELFTLARQTLLLKFRKGVIDSDTLLSELVAIGVDADIARATVGVEVARRTKEAHPPTLPTQTPATTAALRQTVSDLQKRFVDGAATLDQLTSSIQALQLSQESLEAIVAQALETLGLSETPSNASA